MIVNDAQVQSKALSDALSKRR